MNLSSLKLRRGLRLTLLLAMLASQGIVTAHEPGFSHSLDSHPCSICLVGHGLGDAASIQLGMAEIQVVATPALSHSVNDTLVTHSNYYASRGPPPSLWHSQNPN